MFSCCVSDFDFYLSHSLYVLKREELCSDSFAQAGSWSSFYSRKHSAAVRSVHTRTRVPALVLRKAH